jgi:1-acyl-sn-glycerol-3-phosphate acyltransferase
MRRLAALIMRIRGWEFAGERPRDAKFVALGAPHTSNWDFLVFLAVVWHFRIRARAIGKQSLVRWPFGRIMRRLGVIPVERDTSRGVVEQMVHEFASSESMALVIAPEGTRSRTEYWRSGFYQIALAAQVPIVLAYVDGANKVAGIGPTVIPTRDVVADMAEIRDFYAPIRGVRPERQGPIRLRREDGEA